MSDFKLADNLHFHWAAGEVCFDCQCGKTEIILSESGEVKTCECGCAYRLQHYVEVKESEG